MNCNFVFSTVFFTIQSNRVFSPFMRAILFNEAK